MSRAFNKGDGTTMLMFAGGVLLIIYAPQFSNRYALDAAGFALFIVGAVRMFTTKMLPISEHRLFEPLLSNGVKVPLDVVFQFSGTKDPEGVIDFLYAPISAALTRLFSASNDIPSHEDITEAIESAAAKDVQHMGLRGFRIHVTRINIPQFAERRPTPKAKSDPGIKIGD